jgi:hypothetical protein
MVHLVNATVILWSMLSLGIWVIVIVNAPFKMYKALRDRDFERLLGLLVLTGWVAGMGYWHFLLVPLLPLVMWVGLYIYIRRTSTPIYMSVQAPVRTRLPPIAYRRILNDKRKEE